MTRSKALKLKKPIKSVKRTMGCGHVWAINNPIEIL